MSLRHALIASAACALAITGAAANPAVADRESGRPGDSGRGGPAPSPVTSLVVEPDASSLNQNVITAVSAAAGAPVQKVRKVGDKWIVQLAKPLTGDRARAVAAKIAGREDVDTARPNPIRHAFAQPSPVKPNDAKFSAQINLWDPADRISGVTPFPPGGYSAKAPALWRATVGSPDVIIANLDTGIAQNTDLPASQLVPGYDFVSDDISADDSTPGRDADPTDTGDTDESWVCDYAELGREADSWHGTHTAGIAAAVANNEYGIAGAAPGTRIQPVRVLGRCGGTDADIIDAIRWAAGLPVAGVATNPTPAKVINLSLGGGGYAVRDCAELGWDGAIADARAAGALVVVAAGNEYSNTEAVVPAGCDGAFTVAASGRRGLQAVYSNFGPAVDIATMGGDSDVDGVGVISTIIDSQSGGLATYEGTSMATPLVSAAAALLFSLGLDTVDEVEAGLRAAARAFPAYQAAYGEFGAEEDFFDGQELNCDPPDDGKPADYWCGDGILDLGLVQAPFQDAAIAGKRRVGQVLQAPQWNGPVGGRTYQWKSDGVDVPGGTGPTFTLRTTDLGKAISVDVTPTVPAFASFAASYGPTSAVLAAWSTPVISFPKGGAAGKPLQVVVTINSTAPANRRTGVVRFYEGTRYLRSMTLSSGYRGTRAALLPPFGSGTHTIRAVYASNSDVVLGSSANRAFKLR